MNPRVKDALSQIAYNVCVVTVGRGGVENGLTVSWLTQASFDPPIVVFAVDQRHLSSEFLPSTKQFVVNVLADDQTKLAAHFAEQAPARPQSKLQGLKTRESAGGAAILEDALAWIECDVIEVKTVGDHFLIFGTVEDGAVLREGTPMTSVSSGMRYHKSQPRTR